MLRLELLLSFIVTISTVFNECHPAAKSAGSSFLFLDFAGLVAG